MSERPESGSGARRGSGPLGEDAEQTETRRETQRSQRSDSDDATQQIPVDEVTQRIQTDDATQQIPKQDPPASRSGSGGRDRSSDTQEFQAAPKPASSAKSTKSAKAPSREGRGGEKPAASSETGGRGASSGSSGYDGYSTGYSEVLMDREEYLRDIYGGVDWLASFVGFIFTVLFASVLGFGATLFLLIPLGLQESLNGGQLNSTAITGFAVIAAVAFISFLFGGYISGRMARYDGARNGAMVLLWVILIAALLLVLSGVFGQVISGTVAGDFVREALSFGVTSVELFRGLGVSGAVVLGGVLLAALLGGVLGGRLGSRYHREIDYTP